MNVDPIVNTIVIVLAGILTSLMSCLFGILGGFFSPSQKGPPVPLRAGSASALAGFYGLIGVLSLAVIYGPIKMDWTAFLVSFFGMGSVVIIIFYRAKENRLTINKTTFLDFYEKPPKQRPNAQ